MPKAPWWWITIGFGFFFRWYDLWIGAFIDTKKRAIYICPVPMFGIKIWWKPYPKPYKPEEW